MREYSGTAPSLSSANSESIRMARPFSKEWVHKVRQHPFRSARSCVLAWGVLACQAAGVLSGCGSEAEHRAKGLEEENQRLKGEIQSLEETLSQRDLTLNKLKNLLMDRNIELISSRLGLTSGEDTLDAVVETSMGSFRIRLDWRHAPYISQNFVALAEGSRSFRDPKTGIQVRRPFYDGLTFHRVIPDLLIQGGDPLGNGQGGPGYALPDEIHPGLRHDRPGRVGMANTGPDSNGSQFYVMTAAAPSFDGRYTLFGDVTEGMEVVQAISKVPANKDAQPLTPVIINHIRVIRGVSAVNPPHGG